MFVLLLCVLLLTCMSAVGETDPQSLYDQGKEAYEQEDDAAAYESFLSAAEGGLAQAQQMLGELYFNDNGTAQSLEKAAECLRLAADQGNPDAQIVLEELGLGIE
ncbi:MAG: sel1 repeat family protein [Clostridia bacterium]|nr:sel1 repeat family protein [Clostridia bacterium]